jgi:thiamine biosynthesis lipoprotein
MKLTQFILVAIFCLMSITDIIAQNLKKYQKEYLLMGSSFEIAIISENETEAFNLIDTAYNEVVRIENLISSWKENSQTFLINKNAGIQPVAVTEELFNLIRRAIKISKLTNGAFDITYASMDNLWKFDGTINSLPDSALVKNAAAKINYKRIVLDEQNHTVFLMDKGMKIGFGAIGKGYAANKVKNKLVQLGVKNGMINAGGDLIAWGGGIGNEKWKVGVADPNKEKEYISWLEINDMAVVTSGNYEKFIEINEIKYSHIIDPRNGYPVLGLKSVTIICPDAELADALATAVFVLGEKEGLELINQLNAIECILINNKNEIITSKTLKLNLQ